MCEHWFVELLDAFKEASSRNWIELKTKDRHAYKHDWNSTNFTFEFDVDTIDQYEGGQFSLNKSRGRVHGFIVGNVFYVYWLDPHHNMNNDKKYGGIRWAKHPTISCCEKQNELLEKLASEADIAFKLAEEAEEKLESYNSEIDHLKKHIKELEKELNVLKNIS